MVGSQRPHMRAMTRAVPTRDSGRANGSRVLCRARRRIKATPEGLLHGARGASVMARGARHQARGVGGSGRHARHGTRGAFLHRVQDRRRRDRVGMILFYFAPRPGSPPATRPGIAAGDTSRKAAEKVQEAARYLRSRARTYISHALALQKFSKFSPVGGTSPKNAFHSFLPVAVCYAFCVGRDKPPTEAPRKNSKTGVDKRGTPCYYRKR